MRKVTLQKAVFFFVLCNIVQFVVFLLLYSGSFYSQSYKSSYARKFDRLLRRYQSLMRERSVYQNLREDIITESSSPTHSLALRVQSANTDVWNNIKDKKLDDIEFYRDWYKMTSVYNKQIAESTRATRKNKYEKLKSLIWSRLDNLKYPELEDKNHCPKYNRLLQCFYSTMCGFGCRAHKGVFCSMAALAMNRTMIPTMAPEEYFESLAADLKKCDFADRGSTFWKNEFVDNQVSQEFYDIIKVPNLDEFTDDSAPFMPLKIPTELAESLRELSERPFILFVSFIMRYHFKFDNNTEIIEAYQKKIGLSAEDHYVGIHVRRTDKIIEAPFHSLSEYMALVEEYYDQMDYEYMILGEPEEKKIERKVYLATDEPDVWKNEVSEYISKGYKFFGDIDNARSARPIRRDSKESRKNVFLDVYMLSEANYLVCTFSSQIGRISYELLQTNEKSKGMDMSFGGTSIDFPYYYGGQKQHGMRAIVPNDNPGQQIFSRGDILGVAETSKYGYYEGDLQVHQGSRIHTKILKYPHYKVEEFIIHSQYRAFQN